MIVLLISRYTQEGRKRFVKFVNSSYTLCGESLVTKTDPDVPITKFSVMRWRRCKREMGKCRTERLGDSNRSSPPDPALQSGWGHFSPGYGGGLTGHWAAQWMDICITLAGLFDGSMFWINNGDSWSKKLEGRFFFFKFLILLINLVSCVMVPT